MHEINPTTRKFYRTLRDCDPVAYRSSIEHFPNHSKQLADKVVIWALAFGLIAVLLSVCFGGPS